MNKEQLDEIKSRVSIIGKYKEFDKAVSAMILTKDVPTTIAEVERLQKQHDALVKENKELDAENFRLQQFEKQVQQINNAADRLENGEIDGFDFGEIVLDIL